MVSEAHTCYRGTVFRAMSDPGGQAMDLFPQHLERVVGRASPEVFQDPHHRQGLEVARRLDSARVDGPGPAEVGADLGDLLLRLCIVAGDEHVGRAAWQARLNYVRTADYI